MSLVQVQTKETKKFEEGHQKYTNGDRIIVTEGLFSCCCKSVGLYIVLTALYGVLVAEALANLFQAVSTGKITRSNSMHFLGKALGAEKDKY